MLKGAVFVNSSGAKITTAGELVKIIKSGENIVEDTEFTPVSVPYNATLNCHILELADSVSGNFAFKLGGVVLWHTLQPLGLLAHTHNYTDLEGSVPEHTHNVATVIDTRPTDSEVIAEQYGKDKFVLATDNAATNLLYRFRYCVVAATHTDPPTTAVWLETEAGKQKKHILPTPRGDWGKTAEGAIIKPCIFVQMRFENILGEVSYWNNTPKRLELAHPLEEQYTLDGELNIAKIVTTYVKLAAGKTDGSLEVVL